jgi:hypothetical protein
LRYLQGTKHYMLTYKRTDNLEVIGYSDSDFEGCVDSKKSTSGYVFTLANEAISWKSSKQRITTSSTMYAEFIACYGVLGWAMWLKIFIPGLRVIDSISKALTIYCDNKVVFFFSHNNKSSGASKHIDLRYLVVRERVQDRIINLEHIGTKEMLTNPLTKGLPPHIFEEHVADMELMQSF